MALPILDKQKTLAALPSEWSTSLLPSIQQRVMAMNRTLVVLDDDPTGTQTVHDVAVLTGWSVDELSNELAQQQPVFYVLTNSRSLPLEDAEALNREVGRNLQGASRNVGRDFTVVSRSDSTLRGHFPGEVDALAEGVDLDFDATLIVPFFLEGGRYTISNVHYVAEDDRLIPAAQTPFAADAAFGYTSSDLRHWVAEKTEGRIIADEVTAISLDVLREAGPAGVVETLNGIPPQGVCIVNAASMRDLEVLVAGLLDAEAAGKRFLFRTAASFVQVRAGIAPRPLLSADDLALPKTGGGLFVVGSYVPKTTGQVNELLDSAGIAAVEVNVNDLLSTDRQHEIERARIAAEDALAQNQDTVLYTSRELVTGKDPAASLAIGQKISDSLVAIVSSLKVQPRYIVAKGGITSSDVATKALTIRRALVMGQILPGVPVWKMGDESRFPGLPYIVFPGNVGGGDALVQVRQTLGQG